MFMDELTSLEKQIYTFVQMYEEIAEKKSELEKQLLLLEKENEILKLKIKDKRSNPELTKDLFNLGNINLEDRENLKGKITDLINKIDYHLRS